MSGIVSSIFGGGGGGGGGGAPSNQTITQTSIPEYARPYVENMLGQSQALTNINTNPYQTYGGQRIQGFNPMQQQAFQNYGNQQVAGQLGLGSNIAGMSGLGSLNAGQNYFSMATDPRSVSSFMSPYMQNAVDVQKNEAIRDYQKGLPSLSAMATRQGAFGGSRNAIEQAEARRNLGTQLANIQATGSQNAFNAAQQAQQFGSTLGLQGLGQGLQAASTLGQLGQAQYGQQMGISDALSRAGAVQQAQGQQGLDLAYQDFTQQKNYPYQQLAFMSDMLRGLPLSQSAMSQYNAQPSTLSQLGGLGTTALGIYGMSGGFKKEGGVIKGYKNGGKIGYLDGGEVQSMTTEQLEQLLQSPNLNPLEVEQIQEALMIRRRMAANPQSNEMMSRSGIASIGTGDMVPEGMAGGGIIAFSTGGSSKEKREKYKEFLEEQIRESLLAQKDNKPFEKTDAQIAEATKGLQARRDVAPWGAVADFGARWTAGTSPNTFTNVGGAAQGALGTYAKGLAGIEADQKDVLAQQRAAEQARLARQTGLTGQMQTSLGQIYSREIGAESAASQRDATANAKRSQDYLRAQSIYKDLFNNAYDELGKTAKPGGINYKKYKSNPEQQKIDARAIARGELSQDLTDILGFKDVKVTPPPAPAPAPGKPKKGPVTVAVPGGKSYTFPTQEAADEFKRQANLK
jgi:hypothetical protein